MTQPKATSTGSTRHLHSYLFWNKSSVAVWTDLKVIRASSSRIIELKSSASLRLDCTYSEFVLITWIIKEVRVAAYDPSEIKRWFVSKVGDSWTTDIYHHTVSFAGTFQKSWYGLKRQKSCAFWDRTSIMIHVSGHRLAYYSVTALEGTGWPNLNSWYRKPRSSELLPTWKRLGCCLSNFYLRLFFWL